MKYFLCLIISLLITFDGGFALAAPANATTSTATTNPAAANPTPTAPTSTAPASATAPTAANPPLPTPVGRVIWVKGTFRATMANSEVRTLQKSSVIYLHDTLTTDVNSQAQIAFTDNTLMTFRPETKFVIDTYSYQPQSKIGSVGKYVMSLIEGGFRTITGLIAKSNPNDYKINTPVATIGVRGTDYNVYIHKGELFVGYIQGSPCVSGGGQQLCLDSKTPYLNVPKLGAVPVPLTQQPAVFKEQLQVTPVKIAPFTSPQGPSTKGGVINSFCIT